MPVKWYSKRQKTVETSSYGSELVAARIAIELVQELRYKLRMLGVPIIESTTMYGDNMSVVLNTTVPSSQLKKKHNAISYHHIREAIAAKIIRFAHILPSSQNIADILTKPLPVNTFEHLVQPILFRKPTGVAENSPDAILYSHELQDDVEEPTCYDSTEHNCMDPSNNRKKVLLLCELQDDVEEPTCYDPTEHNCVDPSNNRKKVLLLCDDPSRTPTHTQDGSNIHVRISTPILSIDEQATQEYLNFLYSA
jgi:hypothetical protein